MNHSIIVERVAEGYRLSIDGRDHIYSSIWDVQKIVAGYIWPTPEFGLIDVRISGVNTRGE